MKKKVLGHRVPEECHSMLDELVEKFTSPVAKANKEMILEQAIKEFYANYTGKKPKSKKSAVAERYGAN